METNPTAVDQLLNSRTALTARSVTFTVLLQHATTVHHITSHTGDLHWRRTQRRIIHSAGCTMGGPPVTRGPRRSAAKFLSRCFDVRSFSVRLNVTTTKKVVNFLGKKCTATDKKILASRTRKRPPPYFGMGPPE